MTKLSIRHRTTYQYRYPVVLGPHRMMLRPRDGRDLRLLSHEIALAPGGKLEWATDVFGNAIASATFAEPTAHLQIDSHAEVDLQSAAWPVFDISASAITYPFLYDNEDFKDLGSLRDLQFLDPSGQFSRWVRGFVMGNPTDTLSLLKDLSAGVSNTITYQAREAEGTQTPLTTLEWRSGTCRDFAVFFAEAVRTLGLAARIVSGYLFNPDSALVGTTQNGSTHAWVDVFLPGAGWVTFDPTNRSLGGANLIPVAVVRDIAQAVPISGGFTGAKNAFVSMDVAVEIRQI